MPNIKRITGFSTDELTEMAHEIIDEPSNLAAERARELGAPDGAIVVTFLALDTSEGRDRVGVLPVKTVWMLSGGLNIEDDEAPLHSNAERAWAQTVLGNALARRIDEEGQVTYLRELSTMVARLADQWGYEIQRLGDEPMPRREHTRRSTRPSGRGGRSPKQRRKR